MYEDKYYDLVSSDDMGKYLLFTQIRNIEDARKLAKIYDCEIIEVIVEKLNLGKPV